MFISTRDSFVTNTKSDCERTLRRKERRAERRVYGNPYISGPVYTYRPPEGATIKPFAPKPLSEKEKGEGILSKIGSFFAAAVASLSEASEAELTPNVHMSESDMLIIQSMEESAVEYESEEAAKEALKATKKPYQSKQSIRRAEKLAARKAAEAERAAQQPSILDIKDDVEAEARKYNREKAELIATLNGFKDSMPKNGAFRYIDPEVYNEMSNEELSDVIKQIKIEQMSEKIYKTPNWQAWEELEEYLLFSKKVDIKQFVTLLNKTGVEFVKPVEMRGLSAWLKDGNAKNAGFRYNDDVVHNWNITNLKTALFETYQQACIDGGKLDEDIKLVFPNGDTTTLASFLTKDKFLEITNISKEELELHLQLQSQERRKEKELKKAS